MGVTIADLNHVHRRGSGACRPTRPSLGSRQRRGLRRVGHAQRQWPMALGPLRHTALHIMGVIEVARVRHTALARSLTAHFSGSTLPGLCNGSHVRRASLLSSTRPETPPGNALPRSSALTRWTCCGSRASGKFRSRQSLGRRANKSVLTPFFRLVQTKVS